MTSRSVRRHLKVDVFATQNLTWIAYGWRLMLTKIIKKIKQSKMNGSQKMYEKNYI